MKRKTFSVYHDRLWQALASELNLYADLSSRVAAHFRDCQLDHQQKVGLYRKMFGHRIEESWAKITLLAASYVEAIINIYLANSLTQEEFEKIDPSDPKKRKMSVWKKWTEAPKKVKKLYSLKEDDPLFQDFKYLFEQRNALTHMKPKIQTVGRFASETEIHQKGNLPEDSDMDALVRSWATLPDRLVAHLNEFDQSHTFYEFRAMSGVAAYMDAISVTLEALKSR